MKKVFKLENLDCANCAAKIERNLNKIAGVNSAVVTFMTLRLDLDIDESREQEIMEEVIKTAHKTEPDLEFIER